MDNKLTEAKEGLKENLKLCTNIELLYFITKCIEELTKRSKE